VGIEEVCIFLDFGRVVGMKMLSLKKCRNCNQILKPQSNHLNYQIIRYPYFIYLEQTTPPTWPPSPTQRKPNFCDSFESSSYVRISHIIRQFQRSNLPCSFDINVTWLPKGSYHVATSFRLEAPEAWKERGLGCPRRYC
jgi:hypothetical protein